MSRRREFEMGSLFHHIAPPLPPMATAPWVSSDQGEHELPVRRLRATQKKLSPERVQHYIDHPSDEPITVIQQGGKPYIYDGHHRVVAAKKTGQQTVRARVRRWD